MTFNLHGQTINYELMLLEQIQTEEEEKESIFLSSNLLRLQHIVYILLKVA
jgi:hypothetical protein